MKVVMITNNINQIGGIERVICNLSNALNTRNINVEIISIFSSELKSIFDFHQNIKISHLDLKFLDCNGIKNRIKNNLLMQERLYNQLKELKCDVIITFHPFISEWIAYVRKKSKATYKLVITEHLNYENYSFLRRLMNINTYRKGDRLVVLSNHHLNYYKRFLNQVVLIPNGIRNIPNLEINYNSKNIICVGRLEEVKGFDLMIESFGKIANEYNEWKLIIVGDGSQREKLKKQVSILNLEKQVIFLGFKDNIIEEMKQASIFILPSRQEGFGLVLLEALSCGLACISYDAPWSRDMITDKETGLMAQYLDIDDLANQLEKLMDNPKYRKQIGLNGKKEVEKFLLDNIVLKWEELLYSI